ncbi:hypothetical protein KKH30_04070 [Candidatus Micrarchaeota archaeon]|nr:hypothetical protein [Candidatus Micrarchaeota archaeon]MBU1939916.1 hypothetical protein [Candidatus Micrarchaeota archaeon]
MIIPGTETAFQLLVTYPSGAPVEDAEIIAELNGETIAFTLAEDGYYYAQHTFASIPAETAVLSLLALDAYDNAGQAAAEFSVSQQGLGLFPILAFVFFSSIVLFLILFILLLGLMLLALASLSHNRELRLKKLRARKTELLHAKEFAKKQLDAKEIDRAHYDTMIAKYDKELNEVNASIVFLEKKRLLGDIFHSLGLDVKKSITGFAPKLAKAEEMPPVQDEEIEKIKEIMKLLEREYLKRGITEQQYREKLFDYKTQIHILEMKNRPAKPAVQVKKK